MKKLLVAMMIVLSSQFAVAATELTEANLVSELVAASKANKTVVIKFYATWCGHCANYAPVFAAVEKEYLNKDVAFFQIDVDKQPRISAKIQGLPTTIIAKGKVGGAAPGELTAEQLKSLIEKVSASK